MSKVAGAGDDALELTFVQVVGTTLAVVASMIFMIWTVYTDATNKNEQLRKDLNAKLENYLTLREHEEFVRRFTSDIQRIESINATQSSQLASKVEVGVHNKADTELRRQLEIRLDTMQRQLDLLMTRSMIKPP